MMDTNVFGTLILDKGSTTASSLQSRERGVRCTCAFATPPVPCGAHGYLFTSSEFALEKFHSTPLNI